MKNHVQEYFYFTRGERNGAFLLLAIAALLCVFPSFYQRSVKPTDFTEFRAAIAPFMTEETAIVAVEKKEESVAKQPFKFNPNTVSKSELLQLGLSKRVAQTLLNFRNKGGKFYKKEDLKKVYGLQEADYLRLEGSILIPPKQVAVFTKYKKTQADRAAAVVEKPFEFDPNTATKMDLQRLGLSSKIAANIVKYRASGGSFRIKKDLSKIYGLSTADYDRLEPFINLPTERVYEKKKEFVKTAFKKENVTTIIDINKADLEDWQSIYGIGPYYAQKIVNFRDKLGGFSSISQVGETRALPDSVFQKIVPSLKMSPISKKIAINTASEQELKQHPYLKGLHAKVIVKYRKQHGSFGDTTDLKKVIVLNDDLIKKISPYLSFD